MQNKYLTLQTIYELVKNDAHPTSSVIYPNEIIVRQNFGWDECVKHLDELRSEHLIEMKQHSPAVILLTEQGFQFILAGNKAKSGNFMYAA
jgi:predicted transcriptional regulator